MAIKINPSKSGGEAGRLLRRLNYKTRKQRENDRVTFGGLFNRADAMYDNAREEAPMSETFAAVRRREEEHDSRRQRDIILGRQLAQLYDERRMHEERDNIERSLNYETEAMEDHHRATLVVDDNMDFHNPTASMIADAKSM